MEEEDRVGVQWTEMVTGTQIAILQSEVREYVAHMERRYDMLSRRVWALLITGALTLTSLITLFGGVVWYLNR